ncbi:MAG: hypothetical protein ACREBU_02470 [Nitrososphaera sp.]
MYRIIISGRDSFTGHGARGAFGSGRALHSILRRYVHLNSAITQAITKKGTFEIQDDEGHIVAVINNSKILARQSEKKYTGIDWTAVVAAMK